MKKLLILVFILIAGVGFLYQTGSSRHARVSKMPGHDAFKHADRKIFMKRDDKVAHGNSEEAQKLATIFALSLQAGTKLGFEGHNEEGLSLSGHSVLTYCRLNPDSCAFLVRVPELRRYKDEVRDTLALMAWTMAEAAAKRAELGDNAKLAFGLRGAMLYGPVWVGTVGGGPTVKKSGKKEYLFPFFVAAKAPTAPTSSKAPAEDKTPQETEVPADAPKAE